MCYFVGNFEQCHLSALTQAAFLFVVLLTPFECRRILVKERDALIVLLPVVFEGYP
jgi:hypothetical protein